MVWGHHYFLTDAEQIAMYTVGDLAGILYYIIKSDLNSLFSSFFLLCHIFPSSRFSLHPFNIDISPYFFCLTFPRVGWCGAGIFLYSNIYRKCIPRGHGTVPGMLSELFQEDLLLPLLGLPGPVQLLLNIVLQFGHVGLQLLLLVCSHLAHVANTSHSHTYVSGDR